MNSNNIDSTGDVVMTNASTSSSSSSQKVSKVDETRATFEKWAQNCVEVDQDVESNAITTTKDAREYFSTLPSVEIVESLSLLVSILPFSSGSSKLRALRYLSGSLETARRGAIPHSMCKLLGTFLMEHAGPICTDTTDSDEVEEEAVRDVAMTCIQHLLSSQDETQRDGVRWRMDTAKKGLERRCASLDIAKEEIDHGYDQEEEMVLSLDGLSKLPRAKRALCFRVLDAAITGVSFHYQLDDHTKKEMTSFATFTATCLHGESDPRCLLQMLQILNHLQTVFLPLFADHEKATKFPSVDLFDAVAPYYPVQFTPPPNDVHGITRATLHDALMAILCEEHVKYNFGEPHNREKESSMTTLATRLFLERLSSDNEEEDINNADRLEALHDMTALLLDSNRLCFVSDACIRELSDTLFHTHEDASNAYSGNGDDLDPSKQLADSCRNFVARLCYLLGKQKESNQNTNFWEIFVRNRVQKLSSTISSSPQSKKGRTATAYLATMAASGCAHTLEICLDAVVPTLLSFLKDETDQEKMASAAYGLSVLFSSARVTMEVISSSNDNQTKANPHPLQKYGSLTLTSLCTILCPCDIKKNDSTVKENENLSKFEGWGLDLKVAAAKALDSVLQSTPSTAYSVEDAASLRSTLLQLLDEVTRGSKELTDRDSADWNTACARIVGSAIGRGLSSNDNDKRSDDTDEITMSSTVFDNDAEISAFIEDTLLPRILASSESMSTSVNKRYDWMTLAHACEFGNSHLSERIVSDLVRCIVDSIQTQQTNLVPHPALTPAMALSHVIRYGGPRPRTSFHALSKPHPTSLDIVFALSMPPRKESASKPQLESGMSTLMLPESRAEHRSETKKLVQLALSVLPYLMLAYQHSTPTHHINKLLDEVAQVLPPLSDWDNLKLCVILPILSTVLTDLGTVEIKCAVLQGIVPYLAEYAMSLDYGEHSRSAAASCIFSILSKYSYENDTCSAHGLLTRILMPAVVRSLNAAIDKSDDTEFSRYENAINLAALVGSAAACRGKSCSKVGDEVVKFLVFLASENITEYPELSILEKANCRSVVKPYDAGFSYIAATALGSMLSVENGSPFWRQRMAHIIVPSIMTECPKTVGPNATLALNGLLVAACHVACSVSMSALGQDKVNDLASILMTGLASCTLILNRDENPCSAIVKNRLCSVRMIALAALLKIMATSPTSMIPHYSTLVSNLLLITISCPTARDVPCHLLALQGLMNVTMLTEASKVCELNRDNVVQFLADSINHPSYNVRQASVLVRNTWCIME